MTFRMPPDARLTELELRVRDLDGVTSWYADVLGFRDVERDSDRVVLALEGRQVLLILRHDPDARSRPYPCPGLYHFALLVPDRPALGTIFRRLIDLGQPLEGMAEHGVSEALYLRDPEMNGIELYRDRPREQWPREAGGEFAMMADPLDVDGILGSANGPGPLRPETVLGHVHFHVRSLEDAERFYHGTLGLEVTQRSYRGALFLAAGDYHHHVGTNTWAPNRDVPEGATGLTSYTWSVPPDGIEGLRSHVQAASVAHTRTDDGLVLEDPVGTQVRVSAAGGSAP